MEKESVIERVKKASKDYKSLLVELLNLGGANEETIKLLSSDENIEMFKIAFIHKSAKKDKNYQRVEFLGDSLINAIVALYLYNEKKADTHIDLTNRKHKMISSRFFGKNFVMSTDVYKLLIPPYEQVVPTLKETERNKLPGDIFEAMIGMLWHLLEKYRHEGVVFTIVNNVVNEFVKTVPIPDPFKDPKTAFKELIDAKLLRLDKSVQESLGLDHLNTKQGMYMKGGIPIHTFEIYIKGEGGRPVLVSNVKGDDEYETRTKAYKSALLYIEGLKK